MRIDLHMHSNASDGVLAPADLVALSHRNGVRVMALTDHDTVAGLSDARAAAQALGIRFIDGVELSVTWHGKTIHVVALAPKHFAPYEKLSTVLSQKRRARARAIADKFNVLGIDNMYDEAIALAGNPLNLSRRHFAMALIRRGVVKTEDEAFDRFLKDDGSAFVKTEWMSLEEAMRIIGETGAIAVMAHPGRYRFKNGHTVEELLEEFKRLGGRAIEVTTGSHFGNESEYFAGVALRSEFFASTGSDYHGDKATRPEPGMQETLPSHLPTVLDLLDD